MGKSNAGNYQLFEYYAIFLTICMIPSVTVSIDEDIYAALIRISMLFFVAIFVPYLKKDLNLIGFLYCGAITLGFIFHRMQGLDVKLFGEALTRIVPILIILHYSKKNIKCSNKIVRLFILSFYVLECLLAIYEKVTLTHLINYDSESQAMNVDMYFDDDFRSFSLIGHPLFNANIVSLILAFILCSNSINILLKVFLIILGLGAIWAFNSRACMLMWIVLIFYRVFLYGKSLKWILTVLFIFAVCLPGIIVYLQKSGGLGRLTFDFSDGSTLTRIMAFEIFLTYPWSLSDMIFGGVLLEMPTYGGVGVADYVTIENGYLLDLGYWGFVLGSIKILGGIVISYQALHRFNVKDKIIIMLALWGVASMNNNTFLAWLMTFYMCTFLAFGVNHRDVSKDSKINSKGKKRKVLKHKHVKIVKESMINA